MVQIIERRRYMGGKSLPYDYEVEYLESSGTQYIELPFGFYFTDQIDTVFAMPVGSIDMYLISTKLWNTDNNRFGMGAAWKPINTYGCAYGSSSTGNTSIGGNNDGFLHHWEYNDKKFRLIDLELSLNVSAISFGPTTTNITLFYDGNSGCIKGKIKSYKHIKNNIPAIDLIPVVKDGVGYMYDKVSGQLFGNAGTGSFILGPDV